MSIKFSSSLWGRVFFCCALLAVTVISQSVTGTISGTVVDTSENSIVGAIVTVTDTKTGYKRSVTTNNSGVFVVPALQPNIYTIKIEHGGFRSLERQNNVLTANETLAVGKLVMEIGQITEVVTTVAEGATIEKESSDLTGRITASQIELISTKGRSITSLLSLIPGVAYVDDPESVGDGFGTDLPNINGQRGRSTFSAVNGLNASEPSGANKISMTVNQDAIAEVKILRNSYAAEYGNNGGAQIDIVTKSGQQKYFGSSYLFMRNEALNANSHFNNKLDLPRALYRHTIWGFNGGGPVQIPWLFPNKEKKNLFFFYSLEKPHTITPSSPKFVTVPTALERNGDYSQSVVGYDAKTGKFTKAYIFDPLQPKIDPVTKKQNVCQATPAKIDAKFNYQGACFRDPSRGTPDNPLGLNIIPLSRFNSSGGAILNYFPLPNQSVSYSDSLRRSYNYIVQKSVDVPKFSQIVRVDYKPTEKDSFFVNLLWWNADNIGFDTSGWPTGAEDRWGISSHYLYKEKGMSLSWTRLISSSIVNEVSIGVRHGSEGFIPSDGEIERLQRSALNYTAPQLFPQNNTLGTIPRATSWSGISNTTVANINWLDRWGEVGNDYILPAITNNLTVTYGNHNTKFGFYLERMRNGEARGGNWSGTFSFNGSRDSISQSLGNTGHPYSNALTGFFASYSESSSRPHTDLERTLLQWYAQDQWRASSRLTLNYGLRMGWFSHWAQRQLNAANFIPSLYDPKKAPALYRAYCAGGTPATVRCEDKNRRAQNPLTGQVVADFNLVGTFVAGSGDLLNGIVLGSDSNTPHGFKTPAPIQFEPRLGFALSLSQSGKTVLRGHGGVYHSSRTGGGTSGGSLVGNPPYQRNLSISNGYIDNLVNLTGTALQRPTNLNALEVNGKTPTIYNFSLGIQQSLGFGTVVEISYVGSQARHLGETRNINGVPDGARFLDLHPENRNPFSDANPLVGGALPAEFLRPYQGYGDINMVTYSGNSNYNALQVAVNRRYARGFQYGIAYTWHKTLDYANDDNVLIASERPYKAFNYGPADKEQSHIFIANYIWDIPRLGRVWNNKLVKSVFDNWQLTGKAAFVTGEPKALSAALGGATWVIAETDSCPTGAVRTSATSCTFLSDFTGGQTNARALVICDPNKKSTASDGTSVFLDESCFARPTERGEIGNAPRNMLRRPGVVNFDMALFKNIKVREKFNIQFRWETYNIFNHTNFNDINASLDYNFVDNQMVQSNPLFGQPTSARPPRVMQGSLRISF